MNNTIADFGFNTDLENDGYTAWENIGTKYNFNVNGKVLGMFSGNNQDFLLSQVTSSFGDDCMVGTIDAREITIESAENSSHILISNNEPSKECMAISRMLSGKDTREELSMGKTIEQTKGFETLAKLGIKLERQDVQFGEKIIVCGVERSKFENFKNAAMNKTR
ncbi:MAG: hypothetical protein IKE75_05430 [Bacilli bacterium]|nr:hypothetical protein [Bacilli bacterium]